MIILDGFMKVCKGYKNIFNNYELDISKYFCTQFVIFNKSHKELFKKFEKFYKENVDEFIKLQTKTVKRGTCQTPLNYITQMNDDRYKLFTQTV